MANLNFKGKTFVQNHHLAVPYHQLVPVKSKSLTANLSLKDNLIIHGDNLKALKALLPTYAGKIKCIYIDPPYNTGNESWVYNDNVNSPMIQEWLGKVVDREDLTRHDKWLCMMTPRLKILRDLLNDDGIIFISIDDNELYSLKLLMDEVFGEHNFIANFIWKKKGTSTNVEGAQVSSLTDYILTYGKRNAKLNQRMRPKEDRTYPYKDKEGNYRTTIIEKKNAGEYERESMQFKILGQSPRNGKRWQIGEGTAIELEKKKRFICENGVIKLKIYDFEDKDTFSANPNLLLEVGTTDSASKMVNIEIFNEPELFANPKPTDLLKHLFNMATDKQGIILDSFAGSGTTAHAVLDLNKEDDGNRKFILVETEDYADKITAERVRRIIKGVPDAKDEILKKGLGGTFSYFELGDAIEMESILEGKKLPSYGDLARYIFYTATGEEFKPENMNEKKHFIGETKEYEVYLFYKPDIEYLKSTAFRLDDAESLGTFKGKKRLVFAPTKYLDMENLLNSRIEFCQLPFEIYRMK
ncbi:MAG: DNA methylase [Elusimicrobia bacterium RIFOXYA2_FULL_50_26]|nr:MAG: DNA methylase [Elusimicrobia bacterium RIFOXYA2_FULL_50_26]OGS23399.1 MAG: DNA methylase [Elusimicrobia bacterium RIFOXYB2_FULL_50_12]